MLTTRRALRRVAWGFTLVELLTTLVLLAVLLGLAAPAMGPWVRNTRVRTVGDGLQTGLRLAQAEAVRRSRQVVFFLTADRACRTDIAAAPNAPFWAVRTVAQTAGDAVEAVQCGALADSAPGVTVAGPIALCFNSAGRLVANPAPGVTGAACVAGAPGALARFDIAGAGGDRPLRVTVSPGGQIRMCDPARALAAGSPDGCPA